jgi:hypothetical protein
LGSSKNNEQQNRHKSGRRRAQAKEPASLNGPGLAGDAELTLKMLLDEWIDCVECIHFLPARRTNIDMSSRETALFCVQAVAMQRFQMLFNPLAIHSHFFFFP